jgi:monoamine oxidase
LKFKNNNIDANIFLKQSFKNTLSIKDALNLSDKDFLKEYQNVIDNKISSKYIPAEVEDIADVELYIASTNELRSIQEEIDSLLNKINKIKEQVSKKERSAVEVRNEIFLMEVKAKKTLLGIESEKVAVAKKSLELK